MNTKIFTHLFNRSKLLFAMLWLAGIVSGGEVLGQSTEWLSPSYNINNGADNSGNVYTSDNTYATFDLTSDNVIYYGFPIAIPAGKVVKGVEVLVEGHKLPLSARNFNLSISWDGGSNFVGPKTTTGIPESVLYGDETVYVGGTTDNWGWSPTTFTNFRVKVEVTSGWDITDVIYLDLLQVRITYGDPNSMFFESNGQFTVPDCVNSITVQAWGGGGAGGGTTSAFLARGGAGGGGGAYVAKVLTVTSGATLNVVVGAAVNGISGNNGANGNVSYIDGYQSQVYAVGGSGGIGNVSGGSPLGGTGGSIASSIGDIVVAGNNGVSGATGAFISSGAGGSGGYNGGIGGAAITSGSASGKPGLSPGGGGSGGRSSSYGGNQTGGNGAAGRVIITWMVNTTLPPTGDATQTMCNNGTLANLTVTGSNIRWYTAASNGTELPPATALVNGTTYYASQTIGGCESVSRLAVTVVINTTAAPTGAAAQSICRSGILTDLIVTGSSIKWYDAPSAGALLPSSLTLMNGVTYYASQTVGECESPDRLAVTVTINDPAAPTGEATQTFCNSATVANLVANGTGIQWYDDKDVLLGSETPLVNGALYFASQTIEGCEGKPRLKVIAVINTPPSPTGSAAQTFCNSATVANLKTDGGGIVGFGASQVLVKWYDVASGGTELPVTTPLENGKTYYASTMLDECESIERLAVVVTINQPGAPWGPTEQKFCNSAIIDHLDVDGSNIKWYNVASDGTELPASTPLVSGSTYYASQTIDGCESIERLAVFVQVIALGAPTGETWQTFCNSAIVDQLEASGMHIRWHNVEGQPLGDDVPLVDGQTYYATQQIEGCESISTLAVTVAISAPKPPEGPATQTFCNSATVSDLIANGEGLILWYDAANNLLNGTDPLTNNTHYYASQSIEGCESIGKLDVTVVINTPPAPTGASAQTLCQGATVADLRPANYGTGLTPTLNTIKWYNASGTLLNSTDALVNGAHYFASQTIDNCESVGRLDVTVTISVPSVTGTLDVCAGSTRTLTGSPTAAAVDPWKSSDPAIATVSNAGVVSGIAAGPVTITYTNSFGCTVDKAFTVKALPVPTFVVTPTSPNATGKGLAFQTQPGKSNYAWTITGPAYGIPLALCGYNKSGATSSSNTATITWKEEGAKTVTVNYSENGCTGATPATVTIDLCYPVSITTQPISQTYKYTCEVPALSTDAVYKMCVLGSTVSLPDGITYQWYSNAANSVVGGTLIPGATEKTYTPPANGVGDYYYYAIATRKCQSDTTDIAHIKVEPAPVAPVDANFLYHGPNEAWTSGATSNIASVPLLVHFNNNPGQCGDITTARVTFLIKTSTGWSPIPGASNLPVNYIDPNDPSKGGAASTLAQFNIGSSMADVIDLKIVVSGNYTGAELATITIARPTPGGLICGAAFLCNTNSTGFIKGATTWNLLPTFSTLNFYVAYNKSLKNPQGKLTLYVPSYNRPDGTVDNVLHLYVIRSNAISSLVVTKPTASFISKANVSEMFIDLATLQITETLLEGNCKVVMDMTDGSPDKVGITVYRNKGGIWYANNWIGGKTVQQAICLGSLTATGVASERVTGPVTDYITKPAIQEPEPFDVTVQSNPTSDRFVLKVKGSLERIDIRVLDINGKVVEVRNQLTYGTPVYLGGNYIAGVYFAEVIQGPNRKMVKLIKQ